MIETEESSGFGFITFGELENRHKSRPPRDSRANDVEWSSFHERLRGCPDIYDSFPCIFYIEVDNAIACRFFAVPDRLFVDDKVYQWAWAGALYTEDAYRGKGLATRLVRGMEKTLHERNIGWGGVFSNDIALAIYRKLGFTIPGFAPRYLMMKTIRPLLEYHLGKRKIVKVFDVFYRTLAKAFSPALIVRAHGKYEMEIVDADGLSALLQSTRLHHAQRYHFDSSAERLRWKIGKRSDMSICTVREKKRGRHIGYFITKTRPITEPFGGKYKDFMLMTMMDYGVCSDRADGFGILVSQAVGFFMKSNAEVFELITTAGTEKRIDWSTGLVKAGRGMSFKYSIPSTWNFEEDSKCLTSWELNHFSADAFAFY
ncbi:MAG TPA: GNAT family N-acetyltransferase [Deltaproteobacteria bacterium]|nr:GNAT family N-acetyltransferase [Deltaproteobacteria bacterium]